MKYKKLMGDEDTSLECLVNHESLFFNLWEMLNAICTIYYALIIPYQLAVRDMNYIDHSTFNANFYWFSCVFYILDIPYNMVVQKYDIQGKLTKTIKKSTIVYLRKTLFFDLISNLIFYQLLKFGEILNDEARDSIMKYISTGENDKNKYFVLH